MKYLIIFVSLLGLVSCAGIREEVKYEVNGQEHKGYYAAPNGGGLKPGVIVVHEWWGHNEYVRKRARQLSKMGYHALALDMYGEGKKTSHPKEAKKFAMMSMKDPELAKKRFLKALEVLKSKEGVDPKKIAAIGYCFGGAVVLNMARAGVDLDAVVSFHGSLKTKKPAKKGDIKGKVLVLNGAEDPMITQADIKAFKSEMRKAQVSYEFINYPGAVHAFTNPGATAVGNKYDLPVAYHEESDKSSWKTMENFLRVELR
ncbi:MAG: dienelactone hydrolase [Halobacteriovorax sp.]|nr:dienelactone hydrolase [Halobacteriovorax sp.]|tara:strand:- start:244415 stop:245188 length:774 start_codon:yes stop_codon:yes gene_type:complete